jgi:hypothetical protein
MRICKITNIKSDGKPWESQYGTMYPLYVVLEDGGAGTTNSKTEVPPYKVGDSVGYDITGSTPRGVPKIKITRNPKPGEGTAWTREDENPELEAARPTEAYGFDKPIREPAREPQAAPQRSYAQTHAQTPPARPVSPAASGTPVHGATVGGALARAVDIWIAIANHQGNGVAWLPGDAGLVERITRELVAIQQRVESGAPVITEAMKKLDENCHF